MFDNQPLPEKSQLDKLPFLFSGKLLLRKEIALQDEDFQKLLKAKLLIQLKSITKRNFVYQCMRCGNQRPSLFATIPCHRCKNRHLYCRKCIEMGRVLECEPLYEWNGPRPDWTRHLAPSSWDGELTVDQQKAADRMVLAINNQEKELLCWAVCGSGKTEMLFPGITEALKHGKRICIATPRADVVRELRPRIQQAFANVTVQALYGGSDEKEATAQLIIATTHQLLRFKNAFDLLIIDEIDAFPFHADPSLPFAANRARAAQSTMLYLTATPRKEHRVRINQKKLPHTFVPVRFHGHPLPIPVMNMVFSLKRDLKNIQAPVPFLSWVKKRQNSTRQLLIFVPTIRLAEQLQETLATIFLKEQIIIAKDKLLFVHAEDADREEKVNQFRQKELTVLITTTILERGVTFSSVDVAILDAGHEVFDEAALVQIAGRAGRSADDPTGEVIFFHDGKTEAMIQAIQSIKMMNIRGGFA
ncbi:DEAD/DEAH box helicase [Oceanobacillus chungangensis]|uniref:DNA/RNA helicase n=1 Tax=Oceanobacillus chungangensis TaxID=1229152 RepID=A0A3D8PKA9_9BACI|nr:DEAD/DEAH box helicase [Oceanobacillus chungangensis]RDW15661.1 DNA/RNA helicase [Oceanobacillus chungangensis]